MSEKAKLNPAEACAEEIHAEMRTGGPRRTADIIRKHFGELENICNELTMESNLLVEYLIEEIDKNAELRKWILQQYPVADFEAIVGPTPRGRE